MLNTLNLVPFTALPQKNINQCVSVDCVAITAANSLGDMNSSISKPENKKISLAGIAENAGNPKESNMFYKYKVFAIPARGMCFSCLPDACSESK